MQSSTVGTKQMVVSPHYLASSAGNTMLLQGGNAFDAAVAVSACLAVVYPHMTGLGGDTFWLTYHAKENKLSGYNGSGRSGENILRKSYRGKEFIPTRGIESVITVPGMVDSWDAILQQYGNLTLEEVLQPAIHYAENGFPYSNDQHHQTKDNIDMLKENLYTSAIFLPHGTLPAVGDRFVQRDLAKTLKYLAKHGRDGFYKGSIAASIVAYLKKNGGLLTTNDFANHTGNWVDPISTTYRGYEMFQVPPNSQGFVGLMALNILENYDFSAFNALSFDYFHLLTESLKLSIAERNEVLTDPLFQDIPLDQLLDKTFSEKLAKTIQYKSTNDVQTKPIGNDTAFAAVVDEEGNAVSFIQSLYFEYGSGVVAGDTGILMQNRGSFFSLDPYHVNTLEPEKRTFHTLMPAMAFKNGKPYILYGTQGGEGQPQTQTAIITRMLDYHMDPQLAINAPRFVWGRTWGNDTQELKVENRLSSDTLTKLAEAGHDVVVVEDFDKIMGQAHAIKIGDDGFLYGAVDPRSDGKSIGI